MRRILLALILAAVTSPSVTGQTRDQPVGGGQAGSADPAVRELLMLEEELVKAGLRGDAATAGRLMADGYFFVTRDGVVHENVKAALLARMRAGESKAQVLDRLTSDGGETDALLPLHPVVDEPQVRVYAGTGVVVMRSSYRSRGKDGSVVEVPTRLMHVWVRLGGRWQLVAGSATHVAQPKP